MSEIIVEGRPDVQDRNFGFTVAKKYLPYVFSRAANGCLVHKVKAVRLRWYDYAMTYLVRRESPQVHIETICNQVFFVRKRKENGPQMCETPAADAVMCGRCLGTGTTFKKDKSSWNDRRAARKKLGCMTEVS